MSDQAIHVTTTTGLRAVIPQLLRFTPELSMVIIGTEPPRGKVVVTLRYDLPDPAGPGVSADIAAHAEGVLLQAGITTATAVGYGPAGLTGPVAEALRATSLDISVYHEADLPDEPPPGMGAAPAMPDRAAVAASVAPAEGEWARAVRQATHREERLAGVDPAGFTKSGLTTVQGLIARYREDGSCTASYTETATVTVAMKHLRVRDDAWARMEPEHKEAHLRLWTDLTRLAAPGYVAAPAALLAFVAWQAGDGALANVALDRALADDPRYSMAQLLRQAITAGAPPSMARLPLSPEEVAASYDEIEEENA
jgi:uncharacterized protein DUF4192